MPANYDATEFVDTEFEAHKLGGEPMSLPAPVPAHRAVAAVPAPTQEEVNGRILDAQKKLAELKRAQEELERERASLEETRRRQTEFQKGREEMIASMTRGIGLLEEAELAARRDAEQMARTLGEFRGALTKLQAIQEQSWKRDQFNVELTRALTVIENARMEWNAARLKFPVLAGANANSATAEKGDGKAAFPLAGLGLKELCRVGLALTWPLAAVALLALVAFLFALWRGR
jgi:hypothetical protein